jgi:hypothetical protein
MVRRLWTPFAQFASFVVEKAVPGFPWRGSSGFSTTDSLAQQGRNQRSMATKKREATKRGCFANGGYGFRSGQRRQFVFVSSLLQNSCRSCCKRVFSSQDSVVRILQCIGLDSDRRLFILNLGDFSGGSICVHLRHLRLKIRNFHGTRISAEGIDPQFRGVRRPRQGGTVAVGGMDAST